MSSAEPSAKLPVRKALGRGQELKPDSKTGDEFLCEPRVFSATQRCITLRDASSPSGMVIKIGEMADWRCLEKQKYFN